MFIGCGLVDGCCTDIMSRANRLGVLRRKHCHLLQDILMAKAEDASQTFVLLYETARGHKP
jgi:hypothetical protein